jgi:glycosyltransferase involved in cell wall biosynthesis
VANSRVLHFIYSLSGGGAERQLCMLAAESAGHGVDAAVLCAEQQDEPRLQAAGVRVMRWGRRSKLDPGLYRAALAAIDEVKADVVQVWLPTVISIPAMLAARRRGVPCIFCYRNRQRWASVRELVEFIIAVVCADKIISNNPIEQSSWPYRKLYACRAGEAIPNAVQIPEALVRSEPPLQGAAPARLMFVGRLTAQKNILGLLEALAQVRSVRPWTLDVFGAGEQEKEARALVSRCQLSDRVRFRGFSREVFERMAEADVLLFPSLYEGMPNVLIEALALGLPVVASRILANQNVVQDSECVVWTDPGSPADMARQIDAVLNGEFDLGENVRNGLQLAQRFGTHGMVARYAAAYASLTKGAR